MRIHFFLAIVLACASIAAAQEAKPPNSQTSDQTATANGHAYSGMYTFLKEGKFVQVTVEDEVDESEAQSAGFEVVDAPSSKSAAAPTAAEKGKQPEHTQAQQPKPNDDQYWLSERKVGVFERRFSFQGLIDEDGVKAHLEHGLLTVVVPKRKPYVRKVQIE